MRDELQMSSKAIRDRLRVPQTTVILHDHPAKEPSRGTSHITWGYLWQENANESNCGSGLYCQHLPQHALANKLLVVCCNQWARFSRPATKRHLLSQTSPDLVENCRSPVPYHHLRGVWECIEEMCGYTFKASLPCSSIEDLQLYDCQHHCHADKSS